MNTELYDTLGVDLPASADEIKAAYRAKAKQHHPDKGGDADRFGEIQKAYDVLSDPDRRARYDATGATDTSDPAARIEAMAREQVGALVLRILQSNDPGMFRKDWIADAKASVGRDRHRFQAEKRDLEAKAQLVEKLVGRFKAKGTHNIPRDVLSHVKREVARSLEQIEEKLKVADRIEELLKDYEFERDPPSPYDPSQQYMHRAFTTGGTSTWG